MSLAFLKTIKVEDPSTMGKISTRTSKEYNPTAPNSIRVWKSGSVYPSLDLVERFSLEYGNKPAEKEKVSGMAFDVFSTTEFPIFKSEVPLVLINPVAKSAPKTDLFGSTTYNEDGTPKSNVMEQGSTTFGKDSLLPMLEKVYGVVPNEAGYIDLILLGQDGAAAQQPFALPDGKTICFVPKEVSRGDKAGQITVIRRENPSLYVLYPKALIDAPSPAELAPEEVNTASAELVPA